MDTTDVARVVRNEEVAGIVAEVPEGHRHLRTTITFDDGCSITFQEATVAALVRAYITVKTDPVRNRVALSGRKLESRKQDYAEWQLLEECQERS
jgi:hypothetical protein